MLLLLINTNQDLRQYKRDVVFTLDGFSHLCGAGLILVIPAIQQIVRVVMDVPSKGLISCDHVCVKSIPFCISTSSIPRKQSLPSSNPMSPDAGSGSSQRTPVR